MLTGSPSAPSAAPPVPDDLSARGTTSTTDTTSWGSNLLWGGLLLVVLPAIVAFVVVSRRARKRLEDAVDARTKSIARRSASGPILEALPTVPAPHAVINRARVPLEGVDTAASVAALEAGLADPSVTALVTTGSGQPEYADVNYANMDGDSRPDPAYEAWVYPDLCTKPVHAAPPDGPNNAILVGADTANNRDTAYLVPETKNPHYIYAPVYGAVVCPGLCTKPVHAAPPDGPNNAILVGANTANNRDTAYLVPETKNPNYIYTDSAGGAAASPAAAAPEYAAAPKYAAAPEYADVDYADLVTTTGTGLHTVVPAEAPYDPGATATGIAPHLYEYCEPSLLLAQASVSAAGDDGSAMVSSDSPRRS